jgi:hypothetical protein
MAQKGLVLPVIPPHFPAELEGLDKPVVRRREYNSANLGGIDTSLNNRNSKGRRHRVTRELNV